MANIVRLRAPAIIRLGGGASYGSGQFFGQTGYSLTNTLRSLQDIEALKKFAEGDPETFLAYYEIRKKTAKGQLKTQLDIYAKRATNKVAQQTKDNEALASYARTNNHQKYLDYLLGKLDNETDPTEISKLGTQINELRSRVFAAGSGSGALGGGVSQDEYVQGRDKWNEVRQKYEAIVRDRPLTPAEYAEVKAASKDFGDVLHRIIYSTDATLTRKNEMNTQLNLTTGPNETYLDAIAGRSDATLLRDFKTDTDFAASIAPLLAQKKFGDVAKAYAKRAQSLAVLSAQALNTPGAKAIGNWLNDAETNSSKYASDAATESTKLPTSAQESLDSSYSTYWSQLTAAHAKDAAKYPAPKDKSVWTRQLQNDKDAATFSKDVGQTYTDSTFQNLKTVAGSFGPASFDASTSSYKGSPEQVAQAQASDDAIRMLMNVPGGPYEVYKTAGLTDTLSIQMIRSGDLTPEIASIKAPESGYPGETGQTATAPTEQNPDIAGPASQAPGGANPNTYKGGMAPEPTMPSETAAPTAADTTAAPTSGKGGMQSLGPEPTGDNVSGYDLTGLLNGVDTYLTSGGVGDLPEWKKPEDIPSPDVDSLFPFDNSPAPQVNIAPEMPQRKGQPY